MTDSAQPGVSTGVASSRQKLMSRLFGQAAAGQNIASTTSSAASVTAVAPATASEPSSQPVPSTAAPAPAQDDAQLLDLLDKSIDSVVSARPAGSKERFVNPSQVVEQAAASTQVSEVEPVKEMELSPEISAYVEQVKDHSEQLPQEIVVQADGSQVAAKPFPTQKVVVLPITQEEEKEGAKKDPSYSFKWLVTWSKKIIQMFTGKVIYYQEEEK